MRALNIARWGLYPLIILCGPNRAGWADALWSGSYVAQERSPFISPQQELDLSMLNSAGDGGGIEESWLVLRIARWQLRGIVAYNGLLWGVLVSKRGEWRSVRKGYQLEGCLVTGVTEDRVVLKSILPDGEREHLLWLVPGVMGDGDGNSNSDSNVGRP